jgi:16S rRNA (cytosine1402-N4)-methyltransferase
MENTLHKPVLLKEVLEYLDPQGSDVVVDATFGFGGHAKEILKVITPKGKLIGIEQDEKILQKVKAGFRQKNVKLVFGNFRHIKTLLEKIGISSIDRILFDLGISSFHFDKSGRGFSFRRDEPLDMRLNQMNTTRASDLVNQLHDRELADLLYRLGDERNSRRIAKAIVEARRVEKIETTGQLVQIIEKAQRHRDKIHPATRTFQALRIAVNDELNALSEALPQAIDLLKPSGRIVVISFHSGEDRLTKNIFKKFAQDKIIEILTKKPLCPSEAEVMANPRSRSAKLRAAKKRRIK